MVIIENKETVKTLHLGRRLKFITVFKINIKFLINELMKELAICDIFF